MTFKTKLVSLITLLTLTAVGNAALALWTAASLTRQLDSMALAERQLELHLSLQANTNDLFRRYAASLLIPGESQTEPAELEFVVAAEVAGIRRLVGRELGIRGEEELEELSRLDAISRGLESIEREYLRLRNQAAAEQRSDRFTTLLRFMTDRIENEVAPLIAEAVEDERGEVEEVREAVDALAARVRLLAGISVLLALFAGTFGTGLLLRAMLRPLSALVHGTARLAHGDLAHRIPVLSRDELGRLSERFNAMAEELEASHGALRAQEGRLQREVVERTDELQRANARLKAQDETRRRFLADVSHELRTPITVVRGEAEVALRARNEPLGEGARATLAGIVEQADHMGRLVDDLMFVARREAGEAKLALRPVPLAPLLEKAAADARVLAERSEIDLALENDAPGIVVEADTGRLRQLVMVLLDNAMRYSTRGSSVRVRAMRAPGGVAVSVVDEGIGIPADELPRIFERFVRGSNALPGGTGLGLPVAEAIAEAHRGRLTIESREGEGTWVTLFLPVAENGKGSSLKSIA